MKTLTTTLWTLLFFALCQVCNAQVCSDPDAWNYSEGFGEPDSANCVYLQNCEDGTVNRLFWPALNASSYENAEIYITSEDEVDTLLQYTFHFQSLFFDNVKTVCMEEGQCYYLDIYPVDTPTIAPMGIMRLLPENTDFYGWFLFPNDIRMSYRTIISTELDICGVLGWTDPAAMNYWPAATINEGCIYCEDNELLVTPNYVLSSSSMGWHIEQDGEYIPGVGFAFEGSQGVDSNRICLPDGCYELVAGGDAWLFSSIIMQQNGDTILSASLTQDGTMRVPFSLNSDSCDTSDVIYGCTNPLGLNYNPNATVDDGSCDLQNDNCNIEIDISQQDSISQELHFEVDIYSTDYPIVVFWDFGDGTQVNDEMWTEHTYDTAGVYQVCATLYSLQFFENTPLCYDTKCVTINTDEYDFSGGFLLYLDTLSTGVNNLSAPNRLELSPNPVKDKLRCKLPQNGNPEDVKIYGIDGRLVKTFKNSNPSQGAFILDVSTLPKGIYIVFAKGARNAYFSGRFVKM